MADLTNVLSFLGGITVTGVGVAWKLAPIVRRFSHFVDDVLGEEARPGVARKPGLVERVASIEVDLEDIKRVKATNAAALEQNRDALVMLAAEVTQVRQQLGMDPPRPPRPRPAT